MLGGTVGDHGDQPAVTHLDQGDLLDAGGVVDLDLGLDRLAEELSGQVEVHSVVADLGTREGRTRVIEALRQKGPVDYLVNNAGFSTLGPFEQEDIDGQQAMVDVHVTATLALTRALTRTLTRTLALTRALALTLTLALTRALARTLALALTLLRLCTRRWFLRRERRLRRWLWRRRPRWPRCSKTDASEITAEDWTSACTPILREILKRET